MIGILGSPEISLDVFKLFPQWVINQLRPGYQERYYYWISKATLLPDGRYDVRTIPWNDPEWPVDPIIGRDPAGLAKAVLLDKNKELYGSPTYYIPKILNNIEKFEAISIPESPTPPTPPVPPSPPPVSIPTLPLTPVAPPEYTEPPLTSPILTPLPETTYAPSPEAIYAGFTQDELIRFFLIAIGILFLTKFLKGV
jgi:hypothetical protein